jgi:hypothetical protein
MDSYSLACSCMAISGDALEARDATEQGAPGERSADVGAVFFHLYLSRILMLNAKNGKLRCKGHLCGQKIVGLLKIRIICFSNLKNTRQNY